MAVHQIKITKNVFEPRSLSVKRGDKIQFQLSGREEPAHVKVDGEVLEGDNRFTVGPAGHERVIRGNCGITTYRLSVTLSASSEEPMSIEKEQSGTVNGSITVVP